MARSTFGTNRTISGKASLPRNTNGPDHYRTALLVIVFLCVGCGSARDWVLEVDGVSVVSLSEDRDRGRQVKVVSASVHRECD